ELVELGRRREVERLHRGLLGLAHLLASGEGTLEGRVDHRVLQEVVREPADRVLGLACDPRAQPGRLLLGISIERVVWAAHIYGPPSAGWLLDRGCVRR